MKKIIQFFLIFVLTFSIAGVIHSKFNVNSETTSIKDKYDQNHDGHVNYVSIGDSLTNGFGMDGYYFDEDGNLYNGELPVPDKLTDNGIAGYGLKIPGTYAYMLNEELNGKNNLDYWDQLAISRTRADEFLYIISNGTYPIDDLMANSTKKLLLSYHDKYIESISNAEVIIFNLGTNSFVQTLYSNLINLIEKNDEELKDANVEHLLSRFPEYSGLQQYYGILKTLLGQQLANTLGVEYGLFVETFIDGIIYSTFTYIISYSQALAEVKKLNPDVEFIIMGVPNFLKGIALKTSTGEELNFEEFFELIIEVINIQRASTVSEYNCVFVESENGMEFQQGSLVRNELDTSTLFKMLEDFVKDFNIPYLLSEALKDDINQNQALNADTKKTLIEAIDEDIPNAEDKTSNKGVSVITQTWTTYIKYNQFPQTFMSSIDSKYQEDILQKVKTIFTKLYDLIKEMASYTTIDQAANLNKIGKELASYDDINAYLKHLTQEIINGKTVNITNETKFIGYLYLTYIQDGAVIGHPSKKGHIDVYSDITQAIENDLTASKYIDEKINFVTNLVMGYIDQYGSDVMGKILEYALQEGYIDTRWGITENSSQAEVDQAIQKALHYATHLDYDITGNDYYLALGGLTAAGEGIGRRDPVYGDLVAEMLGLKKYSNKASSKLTATNTLEYLESNEEEIKKATVLSYEQDASALILSALNSQALDWEKYFDLEYVEIGKTLLEEMLSEALGKEQTGLMELVKPMIENLVYGVVAQIFDTVEGIKYINSINSDVEILIIGMYNPLRELYIKTEDGEKALKEMFEYVIEATNTYYKMIALKYENVTFINVENITTDSKKQVIDVVELNYQQLIKIVQGEGMYANKEGHQDIFEAIEKAFKEKVVFPELPKYTLGDLDDNKLVDTDDVVYLLMHTLFPDTYQLNQNTDYTKDGQVDTDDVVYLLMHTLFPDTYPLF